MARNWTETQRNAIYARGGSLLVSAAAGSGKTAVLVERLVELICDPEQPVDVDKLLVVTFSNAAAAEMRQRVGLRLSELIAEAPQNNYLQKQQALLGSAHISTIHSFCLDLIRRNFQNLEVAPDFAVIDETELDVLRGEAADEAIEQFYGEEDNEVFHQLVELLSGGRDDKKLAQTVQKIYGFARAHPFYEDWLDNRLALYDPEIPVAETVWGQSLLDYAGETLTYCRDSMEAALDLLWGDEKLEKAYLPPFQSDLAQLETLLDRLGRGDWDGVVDGLRHFEFARLGTVRGGGEDKERAKSARDRSKKLVQDLSVKYINATAAEFAEDIEDLRPKIEVLFRLVKEYGRTLDEKKRIKRKLDFSDLEHLTLRLLVEKQDGRYVGTAQAAEVSRQFEYILVDEYQDTNEVQDLIFVSISRNSQNLFMVGDVKQSIYSFRLAMPEIFLKKKRDYFPYNGVSYPAAILLDTNFRSRREVTEGVNFLFERLMSRRMGELDYDKQESLKCGASFPDYGLAEPELLVVDASGDEGERDYTELEAGAVAAKIDTMLRDGYRVADGAGGMRPAGPGDFCILLRSPKNRAQLYVKKLQERGIGAWSENAGGFLQCREVSAVVSMLRALNSPMLDLELAAAMLSPIFGFSDDDLVRIRLTDRQVPLYTNLTRLAAEGDGQSKRFVDIFTALRHYAVTHSADRLIMELYVLTDLPEIVGAMSMGESRRANLLLLVEYAASYHRMGYKGLEGFVGLIDSLERRGVDLAPANPLSDGANVVRILSVHRSKGLEFPVVILADTGRQFNKRDLYESTLLHSRYGFACMRRDSGKFSQYPTIPMGAIRIEIQRTMLSEEMRILYVALTRAREKLIVAGTVKRNLDKKLQGVYSELNDLKLPSFLVGEGNSYLDWIFMALLHHSSAQALREAGGLGDVELLDDGNPWQVTVGETTESESVVEEAELIRTARPDKALAEELAKREAFRYQWQRQTELPTKLAVSEVAKGERGQEYRFAKRPRFLTGAGLTPAEKGNALHKFIQFADYTAAKEDLAAEIARMEREEYLTPLEVKSLSAEKLHGFFHSPLADRIFASKKVYRELRFMTEADDSILNGVAGEMDSESRIVLQGMADCVFIEPDGAVLLDYKTDRIIEIGELLERYRRQMELYRDILGGSLEMEVKDMILYSFALSKWISCC
ncbi:MAG: helicase-exonuclease AddAB subunit AddA [Oscillospiraceae bacterium]